ncbi:MAG: hypothetical protein GEU90_14810 [Gemmatimonas sp.]|nr:hypothetical protein [Gemmatimonas sp.]
MSKLLSLLFALGLVVLQSTATLAQAEGDRESLSSAQPGAFDRQHPEVASLMNAFGGAHGTLLEQLHTSPGGSIEQDVYNQLLNSLRSGTEQATTLQTSMESLAAVAPEVAEALAWGDQFERALLDIYADDQITDKAAAVDQAVTRYQNRTEAALPVEPKFMMASGHEGHSMEMDDGHHSMMFRSSFPNANGLMWASQWLEIAVFDPILFYDTPEERAEGVAVVVSRYRELLEEAPANFPAEMPTPAAVSPELVRVHPQAAAIIDNVHKLYDAVADVLADQQSGDKAPALTAALRDMRDPEHMAVSEYDWILNSLRNGIYFQGGPAIGRLETSERNRSGHGDHGNMVMPGMGGPSGTGMPEEAMPDAGDQAAPPDQGVDHSNH